MAAPKILLIHVMLKCLYWWPRLVFVPSLIDYLSYLYQGRWGMSAVAGVNLLALFYIAWGNEQIRRRRLINKLMLNTLYGPFAVRERI